MSATEPGKANFNQRRYEILRRAGTVEALGQTALKHYRYEELQKYERRQYDETFSAVVEALKGRVLTEYPFEFVDGKIIAAEGEDIAEMLERALDRDSAKAAEDNFYAEFLPKRSAAELAEHMECLQMARGDASYDTIVTISPYTEELDDGSPQVQKKLKLAGQKPQFKRAMVRVSHWDGVRLHMQTRSIDNSSVDLLKQAARDSLKYHYTACGSTEMLAERIHLSAPGNSWKEIAGRIVHSADCLLQQKYGGEWLQGRPVNDAQDLQIFVEKHSNIIRQLIAVGQRLAISHSNYESYEKAFNAEFYNHTALFEELLENHSQTQVENVGAAAAAAGAVAAAAGKSYDMCGLVLTANGEQGSAAQTGYESLLSLAGKKITCPECKSKVTVPTEDLKEGKLTCNDCGHGVDVCTGKTFKSVSRNRKPINKSEPDLFDRLRIDLERYETQRLEKMEAKKLKEELKLTKKKQLDPSA